ncbi:hypothetical protein COEREDRAFT_92470 [Coemansia reversa NRRL 1564]|uniref:Uncharacterized protein n=1 Tax=Coemansia reversa (strain ATCC 12441 / NRRL 1564) TaxID=763665 RepID=A0A2G5BBQ6_COERN|nr:hypothetical protein COEREDRAFT_92470 [Coemansia reversa NRRL 1564]|eukprot:PIA16449.1 hypothetical protein COEREDRAFT_92470 [Coemansia reversa NRRL 1564]
MPLLDRGVRDSTVLPTMKCAQCNQDVHIRLIGQHKCVQQPAVPSLPHGMGGHGLSSFFDASEDRSRPKGKNMRGAVESQAFPSAYKPSLQLLDEEISGNGDEDFDFDSMLQNASMQRSGAASTASLSDGVTSPGMRKVTDLGLSNSNVSIDSLAAGLSPKDFLQIAGRTSPTANGFTIKHDSNRPSNSARLEQAREELLSGMTSPASANNINSRSATSPKCPEYSYPSTGNNSQYPSANVAALHTSLMQKMSSGDVVVPESHSPHQASPMQAADARPPHANVQDSAFPVLSGSAPVSPSPPPLVRSQQHQHNDNTGTTNNATVASANGREGPRSNSSHLQEQQQRWHQPPHSSSENNSPRSAYPAPRSTQGTRAEGVRGTDGNSLPIGGIMRTQATMVQRSISGSEASRQGQGILPISSADSRHRGDSNRSNGSSNATSNSGTLVAQETVPRGSQNRRPSPPAVSVDTRICISARKPSAGSSAAGSLSASPHLPPSLSRSTSGNHTQASIEISHARKPSRNATAPSVMHAASSLPSTNGISGLAKGPLDMLASLMPSDPHGLPRTSSFGRHATPPPNPHMVSSPKRNVTPNTNGMGTKGMTPMPPAGRKLKRPDGRNASIKR